MRFAVLFLILLGLFAPAHAAKRVALVIGNSAYVHANPLPNPVNDAEDIAQKLTELGFAVTSGKDLDLNGMRDTVRGFIKNLDGADVSVFYYAGHGLQVNGINYMVPINAKLAAEDDVGFEAMPMETVLAPMERLTQTNLVFLDACRDNPLAKNLARSLGTRSAAVGKGLAQLGSGVGTLISFATQPGNVALDGTGRNSPFTSALLKHLGTPGQDITRDMVLVRRDVIAVTNGGQVPWDNSSLTGDVILKVGDGKPAAQISVDSTVETAFWTSVQNEKEASFFEQYLERFPKGQFVQLAKTKLELAKRSAIPAPLVVVPPATETKVAALDQRFTEPSAVHPFDGYWEITRTAAKNGRESSCGWPFLIDHIEIKNSTFNTTQWKGKLDRSGNLKGFHYFAAGGDQYTKPGDNIEAGRNRLVATMTPSAGAGKFTHVGGGCRGTLKLVRQ